MRRLFSRKGLLSFGVAGILAAVICLGWKPLLVWYFVRGLSGADEKSQEKWLKRVAWLDSSAVPALLDCLAKDDGPVCANAEAVLVYLARGWGPDDPRCLAVAEQLAARFDSLSAPGREAALNWQAAALSVENNAASVESLTGCGARLVAAAALRPERGLLRSALTLAGVLMDQAKGDAGLTCAKDLVCRGLADSDGTTRVRAVHLMLQESMKRDLELLRQVVPLLHDSDPAVRRAAVLAVGPSQKVIGAEELLPMLHDGDADVRRICETSLRSRGLRDEQILLGRFLSDGRPSSRLQVLSLLERVELQPGEMATWLRRLGRDPAAAVRAGAARAAANQTETDLRDLLRQLADGDESPTVRQLAGYYLKRR
jgi:hypothetical protein